MIERVAYFLNHGVVALALTIGILFLIFGR